MGILVWSPALSHLDNALARCEIVELIKCYLNEQTSIWKSPLTAGDFLMTLQKLPKKKNLTDG